MCWNECNEDMCVEVNCVEGKFLGDECVGAKCVEEMCMSNKCVCLVKIMSNKCIRFLSKKKTALFVMNSTKLTRLHTVGLFIFDLTQSVTVSSF